MYLWKKPVIAKDKLVYDFDFKIKRNYCGIECPSKGGDELDAINEWNNFINKIKSNKQKEIIFYGRYKY